MLRRTALVGGGGRSTGGEGGATAAALDHCLARFPCERASKLAMVLGSATSAGLWLSLGSSRNSCNRRLCAAAAAFAAFLRRRAASAASANSSASAVAPEDGGIDGGEKVGEACRGGGCCLARRTRIVRRSGKARRVSTHRFLRGTTLLLILFFSPTSFVPKKSTTPLQVGANVSVTEPRRLSEYLVDIVLEMGLSNLNTQPLRSDARNWDLPARGVAPSTKMLPAPRWTQKAALREKKSTSN
jgi:hypothetical protein